VGVGRSEEVGRWCEFNTSVSAREGRRWNEALLKDKAETVSSSWLHGKESRHSVVTWRHQPEERRHREGKWEETTSVGLTRIILSQK
jgi:hypothetical protein